MLKRYLTNNVLEALEDTPVQLITGARQTGKSTFCKQLIADGLFEGTSVTMDDPATLLTARSDPMGFLLGLGKHALIDEVQRVPELFLSLKKIIDEDRDSHRFILTGSADVMTLPKVADSLAGRLEIHNLWPFSETEMIQKEVSFLKKLTSSDRPFQSMEVSWESIIDKIRKGGYPESIHKKSERRRSRWFKSYLKSILQKDIRELSKIDGLLQLPKVLNLLSSRVGSLVNLAEIARIAQIKKTSFYRYMALLEQVFLIVNIPAWTPNSDGRYVKSPKIMFNDTGLLCHIKGDGDNLMADRTAAGSLLENFVAMEIIKQCSWFEKPLTPMHFSMHKGAEVDIVLEDDKKRIYGIEVKSKVSLTEKDFRGLKKLEEVAEKKYQRGILFYTGNQLLSGFGGKNIQAVPLPNLWEE